MSAEDKEFLDDFEHSCKEAFETVKKIKSGQLSKEDIPDWKKVLDMDKISISRYTNNDKYEILIEDDNEKVIYLGIMNGKDFAECITGLPRRNIQNNVEANKEENNE